MDNCMEASDYENSLQIVDINNLPPIYFDEFAHDEVEIFNMTSLGTLLLLGQATSNTSSSDTVGDEDSALQRLSLAYEKLHSLPKILVEEVSTTIKILDLSNNEFKNLDFLSEFINLTSFICDHNDITSSTSIPYLPKLELLWLNHCKISELYPWARKLQYSCPNLKYLSLMGNPIAPSYLNGGNFYEYLQYRYFIISLFPNLVHLDDRTVTSEQREQSLKMYPRPILQRIVPNYLRSVSTKISEIVTPTPLFALPKKNAIV